MRCDSAPPRPGRKNDPVPTGTRRPAFRLLAILILALADQTSALAEAAPAAEPAARGRILDREGRVLARNGPQGRVYPYKALASQVLGYTSDGRGRYGVEHTGNTPLAAANDLQLTIDLELQYLVERALRDAGIGQGAVVVMEPLSGDVLAMASVPSFDPNVFTPKIERADFKAINSDPTMPVLHRGLALYPPGSTFKCLTALTLDNPDQRFTCDGSTKVGGVLFRCWNRDGHGELTLPESLMHSCNCYFYQAALESKAEELQETAVRFGLGSKTGIELPGEPSGLVPDEAFLVDHEYKPGPTHVAQLAIGHGNITVTPLQMTVVAAAIGNQGLRPKPGLFLERDRAPAVTIKGLNKDILGVVRQALWRTVNDPAGTGHRAKSDLISISGKTGTAQRVHRGKSEHVGLFIGFAPDDQPRYAITVLVENARSGGTVCAPLAKSILESFASRDAGTRVEVSPLPPARGHTNRVDPDQ